MNSWGCPGWAIRTEKTKVVVSLSLRGGGFVARLEARALLAQCQRRYDAQNDGDNAPIFSSFVIFFSLSRESLTGCQRVVARQLTLQMIIFFIFLF